MLFTRSLAAPSVGLALLGFGIHGLNGATKAKPKVLLFVSTDCPVSAGYTPRINALYAKYAAQGVSFEAVFPNDLETKPGIELYMQERSYRFPFEIDLGAKEAKKLGVTTVPTAVVLDGSGREIYRGAIDDNGDSTLVHHSYLDSTLASEIDGGIVTRPRTSAFGCIIMPSAAAPSVGAVNYAAHIRPILQQHCISCHRPGEVAPFSLIGYANARKWAPMIARVADARQMPPWKAVHGYDEFKNDNSLTETDIAALKNWNEAGAPKGKLEHEDLALPPVPEWALGTPDLIVSPDHAYHVAADGTDVYRNFVIHTNYSDLKYVVGMDVKPGNRRVVHHVVVFIDTSGYSNRLAAKEADGQQGYTGSGGGPGFFPDTSYGGWAPGTTPKFAPADTAFLLKRGANIVVQVHYHKDGKLEDDQTRVGLYFAKTAPKHVMDIAWINKINLSIPAGDANHEEHLNYRIRHGMTIYSVMPHMHLLGKSMKADVVFPDGTRHPLVLVQNWDFHWQLGYSLKEPMHVPAGSQIQLDAIFDNSASNPNNPNSPPLDVHWGEQTTDEMMLLVVACTPDS